jgi:hypothetical protein
MFRPALLYVVFSASIIAQDTATDLLITKWESWSRDAIKEWQDTKLLHGNDLDRTKRLASSIAVAWKRCARAEKVEEILDEAHRRQFDRLIDAILDGSKKHTKAELEALKKTFEAKLATVNTTKNLIVSIARDLESLQVLVNAKLVDAKTLPAPKKKAFEDHLKLLKAEHAVFSAVDLWDDGIEVRIVAAIAAVENLLKAL